MDIGGLETVVANSAYVSARGSIDSAAAATMRDKKYRTKLNLPHIRQCEHMKTTVDSSFDSMCVRQPIGKRLFQQYLESETAHKNSVDLWKDIEDYNVAQENDRAKKAQKMVNKYYESSLNGWRASLLLKIGSWISECLGKVDLVRSMLAK
uniref:RGS domain-containing protein n=1 Tax=Cyprinus carpio TaxID=7962 RepID=A0A8C2FJ96_CYPCA